MKIAALFDFSYLRLLLPLAALLLFLWAFMIFSGRTGKRVYFFVAFFLFFLILSGFLLLLNSPLGAGAVLIAPALVAVLLKKTKSSDP